LCSQGYAREPICFSQCGDQPSGGGTPSPREIEGGSMIDTGPDNGQTEGDIDRIAKSIGFDDG
jgi:hypothetical protein